MGIITIDLRKRQLIYEQIVDSVKEQIGRGILKEDDYMPSVRTLAAELGINPNTIQKAYAELERQGIIQSVPGKGSIVVAPAERVLDMKKENMSAKVRLVAKEAADTGIGFAEFCEIAKPVFDEIKNEAEGKQDDRYK